LPDYFSFSLLISFHRCSSTRKNEKSNHLLKKLIIFITVLHNKLYGCRASVASAAGPFTTKKTFFPSCSDDAGGIKQFRLGRQYVQVAAHATDH
jgi:hypothetical protein